MNMGIDVRFRGRSGKAWDFKRVPLDAPWARTAGVALFAAPDTYGWRIIRTIELSGKPNDVQPIWALADAERYGITGTPSFVLDGELLEGTHDWSALEPQLADAL
jgi:hypothetical protein